MRGRWIFTACAAVIGLHVIVDGLVAPEPGVEPTSHLVPVAVPLVLLAAAVFAFPRVRPGAGAAMSLLLAPPALTGGVVALADLAEGDAAGDAVTGVLLVPAGLVLAGLGAALLWRSRRRTGRVVVRRVLTGAAAALVGLWVVVPVCIAVYATHRPREEVRTVDLGRPHETVTVRTADGLDLAAWYVPSRNGAAVITFPNRAGSGDHARMLVRNGYGVLVLDMRGYGDSEGDPNAFGWGAAPDVRAAVAWLRDRPDVRDGRIAGLGLSVGGEVLLDAAAADPGLRAVIADGAGERSVRETLIRGVAAAPVLPLAAVQTAAVAVLGGSGPPASLEDVVARIAPRPVLLIHAGDGGGGEDLNPDYARAGGPTTRRWEIPGATHTGGLDARPAEYERRVVAFLREALPG